MSRTTSEVMPFGGTFSLAMETTMKADLCIHTLESTLTTYLALEGAIIHSDREIQYTSEAYRQTIRKYHIIFL